MPLFERVSPDLPVTIKTANYSVTADDNGTEIQFESSTGVSAYLPEVSAVANGFNIILRNVGAGALTLDPANSELIDGSSTLTLQADEWRWIRNDGTEWKSIALSASSSGGSGSMLLPDYRGLFVRNNATTPNSKVDLTSAQIAVSTGAGAIQILSNISVTIDITVSGANGLDTGSEAASAWYYIYVIYNSSTATAAGLFSTSSTSPTLPSGYTYSSCVGSVRNDASSNFFEFEQRNQFVYSSNTLVSAGTSATLTNVSISTAVPPDAVTVNIEAQFRTTSGTSVISVVVGPSASLGDWSEVAMPNMISTSWASAQLGEIVMTTPQQIAYRVVGTNAVTNIFLRAYTL
jgi:hypothetical protein